MYFVAIRLPHQITIDIEAGGKGVDVTDSDSDNPGGGPTPRAVLEAVVVPTGPKRRFERWALDLLPSVPTRSKARKMAKREELLVNGQACRGAVFLEEGDRITRVEPPGPPPPLYRCELVVLYEDSHLAVVIKPAGISTNGPWLKTLEHALPAHLQTSDQPDALRWPRPAHRLDGPTGGLVLVGKTASALAALSGAFQKRRVQKRYRAIAIGRLSGAGWITEPVEGRSARSRYVAVHQTRALRSDWLTTLDLEPATGRTHQLRRHLSGLGHPILGDAQYGIEGMILRGKGMFLWAASIGFEHPVSKIPMHIEAPEPAKYESLRSREARRFRRYRAKESD